MDSIPEEPENASNNGGANGGGGGGGLGVTQSERNQFTFTPVKPGDIKPGLQNMTM